MHYTLAVLYPFFFGASLSAVFLPQSHLAASPPSNLEIADKCTFNLWHKQMLTASAHTNYIQLNEIQDHTNDITIDIAALRPIAERNSYTRIGAHHVFAVEELLGHKSLTIRGYDDVDEVTFEHDGLVFSSDEAKNSEEAWCITSAWDQVVSGVGSRERRLQCAFPCEAVNVDEDDIGELR